MSVINLFTCLLIFKIVGRDKGCNFLENFGVEVMEPEIIA